MALAEAWNAIARSMQPPSIFLQHEWFTAAWAWRRNDAQMHMRVARRGRDIVGVLPLVSCNEMRPRVAQYELLTVPDTQLADLICVPADAQEVADAIAADLARDDRWDTLRLDFLLPDGPCVKALLKALKGRDIDVVERDGGRNFFINLDAGWHDYYASRSRRLKKALNLAANRLQKSGDIHIDHIDSQGWNGSGGSLDMLIEISARSWKRDTGNTLNWPGPQAFIRSLSQRASEKRWLEIWLLRLADKPLAMEYGLVFERSVYALRADFDASCVKISPGAHLFRHQLEALFDKGLHRYYMGRGENAYKMRWADDSESLRQVIAYNRTPNGRLEWLREELIKPALRKTRDALRPHERAAPRAASKDAKKIVSRSEDA